MFVTRSYENNMFFFKAGKHVFLILSVLSIKIHLVFSSQVFTKLKIIKMNKTL